MKRVAAAAMVFLMACGGGGHDTVLVSAASSLVDAFADIETAFEATRPGVDVVVNVGGSSALREQILDGAPIDVFASANPATMQSVVDADFVTGAPTALAVNRLVIAVASGNPANVTGLADFAREDLLVGLCGPSVPCGVLSVAVLALANVTPSADTLEPDVRSLLGKIEAGELDLGLVYETDAVVARRVETVAIELTGAASTEYQIALLTEGDNMALGAEFVDFVLSDAGQRIMADFGFGAP